MPTLEYSLIQDSIAQQAALRPDAPAIDEGPRAMTYSELARAMGQVSSVLRGLGVRRFDRVAFFMDNGIEACLAILGILRSDASYVPLHPQNPASRAGMMLQDSRVGCLITTRSHLAALADLFRSPDLAPGLRSLVVLDADRAEVEAIVPHGRLTAVRGRDDITAAPSNPPPCQSIEEDVAYVMFTSGTTGRPKGVMITHRALKAFLGWVVPRYGLTNTDRLSNHPHVSFDISILDIFGAFFVGATVCPLTTNSQRLNPAQFIRDMRITVWFSVPSVIGMMIKSKQLAPGSLSGILRWALFAGEALAPEYVNAWLATHPDIPIENLYGPTEATVVTIVHAVGRDGAFEPGKMVPIGRPVPGTEVLILKQDEDVPAETDETGRLMVCGSQLALGYFGRPDLTAKAFRPNPLKAAFGQLMYDTGDLASRDERGIIHYVGRQDSQVKVRGFRVELGEVEVAIGRHELINEVAVVCPKDKDGQRFLAAFVSTKTPVEDEDAVAEAILSHCERLLPIHMVPTTLEFLPQLPRNENGKIDRLCLAAKS